MYKIKNVEVWEKVDEVWEYPDQTGMTGLVIYGQGLSIRLD